MSKVTWIIRTSVAAGVLLLCATHAAAVAPKVTVSVEPLESGQIVYLLLAPETAGAKQSGQLSLRLSVQNQEAKQIHLNKVTATFAGPPTVAAASIAADLGIGAGSTALWNHESVKNVILPFPAPKSVTLGLHFDGFADPATVTMNLAPHKSPVAGGAYLFPAKASDLRFNEYWTGHSGHGSGNEGSQLFAYDMGVVGCEDDKRSWSELLPGTNGDKNSDWRIWGKPICAVADGTVIEAVNDVPANPKPAQAYPAKDGDKWVDEQRTKYWGKYTNGGAGNHFYIQHGDEVVMYAHMQTGSLNKSLLAKGARVKAGDFLGLAGNSGSSSNPHLHIHAIQGSAPETGPLRPFPFRNVHVVARSAAHAHDPNSPWVSVGGAGLPAVDSHIWPSATKPTWYPPGWAEVARHGIPADQYQAEFDKIASSGYRAVWIDGYSVKGKTFYNVVFRPADGADWIAKHGLTGAQYEAEFQKQTRAGFRLTHIDCCEADGGVHYAAIFSKSAGPAYLTYTGKDSAEHQKEFDKLTKEGWRPTVVSVASGGGTRRHAAIYVKADVGGFWAKPSIPQDDFQREFNENAKADRDLVYINAYRHDGKVYFTAIWHTLAKSNPAARHGMTSAQYQAEREKQGASGQLTQAVAGYEINNTHHFAAIWKK